MQRSFRTISIDKRNWELSALPTLVLTTEQDRIARPDYGCALAWAIPGAQLIEYRTPGRAVTIQSADPSNELLLAHFSRAPGVTS